VVSKSVDRTVSELLSKMPRRRPRAGIQKRSRRLRPKTVSLVTIEHDL
jgi:hypothetical protein